MREMEELRATCVKAKKATEEIATALETLQSEKDREVFPVKRLIQIVSLRNSCSDFESRISGLKEEIASIEATSRKALEQTIEEAELKVITLKINLISGIGGW